MIRVQTEFHGIVELKCDRNGMPLLRLLQAHAPNMRIECQRNNGAWNGYLVPLCQLDLRHSSLCAINVPPLDVDKAQLSSLAQHFDADGGLTE